MTYVDGFVMAVPKANKQQFIEHARTGDAAFLAQGATRVLECWADDVPDGSVTDFRKAGFEETADKLELAWSRQDKTLSLETGDREALLNVLADGPDELADLGSVLLQEQERRRAGGH